MVETMRVKIPREHKAIFAFFLTKHKLRSSNKYAQTRQLEFAFRCTIKEMQSNDL